MSDLLPLISSIFSFLIVAFPLLRTTSNCKKKTNYRSKKDLSITSMAVITTEQGSLTIVELNRSWLNLKRVLVGISKSLWLLGKLRTRYFVYYSPSLGNHQFLSICLLSVYMICRIQWLINIATWKIEISFRNKSMYSHESNIDSLFTKIKAHRARKLLIKQHWYF